MTDADAVLVRVLATADAHLLPLREFGSPPHRATANRYAWTREYAERGVPLRMNARGDEARRKAGERELEELEGAGLIVVARAGRVKFPGVRLTVSGEARARALCGFPDRSLAPSFLAAVDGVSKRYAGGHAPEIDLIDGPDDKAASGLELVALPALMAGWAVALSTIRGHVAYKLTPAGRAELVTPTPYSPGELPAAVRGAGQLYRLVQDDRLEEMLQAEPAHPGEIGLPELAVGDFLRLVTGT